MKKYRFGNALMFLAGYIENTCKLKTKIYFNEKNCNTKGYIDCYNDKHCFTFEFYNKRYDEKYLIEHAENICILIKILL